MSLVPLFFHDWWDDEDFFRPSRLLDQHFGTGLRKDDLLNSVTMPRTSLRNYLRPWRSTALPCHNSGSTINENKDKYQVILDVQQFTPDEITVKTKNNSIIVEGKHDEKKDEHGFVSRHFVRRYVLPDDHDIDKIVSTLSSDGILTVTAPKKERHDGTERIIPITQTGPAKTVASPIVEEPQPKIEYPN